MISKIVSARHYSALLPVLVPAIFVVQSYGQAVEPVLLRQFEEGVAEMNNHSNGGVALAKVNGELFFFGDDGWLNEPLNAVERRPALWKTDGTQVGTVMVKENILRRGASASEEEYDAHTLLSQPLDLLALGNLVVFTVQRYSLDEYGGTVEGRCELWSSDGTEAGTLLIAYPEYVGWKPRDFTPSGPAIYFSAWDPLHGRELWRTDGTEMGTYMMSDIQPGEESSDPEELVDAAGTLVFTADDGTHGRELWKREDRGGGGQVVEMVKDIYVGGWLGGSLPNDLVYVPGNDGPLSGSVVFTATDGQPRGFWATRGTKLSTLRTDPTQRSDGLKSFGDLVYQTWPKIETQREGVVYYAFNDGVHGNELWWSNGSNWGMLTDLTLGGGSSNPYGMIRVGKKVYFIASSGSAGQKLYETDGTASGTRLAFDGVPRHVTEMDGSLYFTTTRSLWAIPGSYLEIEPASPRVGLGDTILLSALAHGTWPNTTIESWRWQARMPGESEFVDISDTSGFFGDEERSTFPIRYATLDLHGAQYRCVATLKNPDIQIESDPVTLGVGLAAAASPFTFDASGAFAWRIETESSRSYRLLVSVDLKTWTVVETKLSDGETLLLSDPSTGAAGRRYYKIEAL